ncbi:MAG: FAD-dependent oxidoreductase, partial [Chloroflexi bacterium]|nr:FAD-dependent oxidoreductase [Chloroflexota bacterium]
EYDSVIAAIGQAPLVPEKFGVKNGRVGTIQAGRDLATTRKGVFAGGDVQLGPASVIEAIAAGRTGAISIDRFLGGAGDIEEELVAPEEFSCFFGREEDFAFREAPKMPTIPKAERLEGYKEVETGYPEDVAIAEARRCLRCEQRLCIQSCPSPPERAMEHAEEPVEAHARS